MEMRLVPAQGGDGSTHGIGVMNDTGFDIMSLVHNELMTSLR